MQADNSNYLGYNKKLQPFANSLRKKMTKAEACLWKFGLRAKYMKGYSFRRQRPVLNYIADFMCKELRLIIEVDGITHTYEGAQGRDAIRQNELEKAGFKVIRFNDEEVLKRMGYVIERIGEVIEGLESTPLPPPAGDSSAGNSKESEVTFPSMVSSTSEKELASTPLPPPAGDSISKEFESTLENTDNSKRHLIR
jgi:very-short-patch-repair endonuclease